MSENDVVQAREVFLERMQIGMTTYLSDILVGHKAMLTSQGDMFARHMCMSMRAYFYGKRVESYTIQWPAGWRESFKERWFPAWALRRWPVRYASRTISLVAAWPTLRHEVPGHELRLTVLDGSASVGTFP